MISQLLVVLFDSTWPLTSHHLNTSKHVTKKNNINLVLAFFEKRKKKQEKIIKWGDWELKKHVEEEEVLEKDTPGYLSVV